MWRARLAACWAVTVLPEGVLLRAGTCGNWQRSDRPFMTRAPAQGPRRPRLGDVCRGSVEKICHYDMVVLSEPGSHRQLLVVEDRAGALDLGRVKTHLDL